MQQPLEIRFHSMDRSDVVERVIRERAAKLEQYARDIVSCRVSFIHRNSVVDADFDHLALGMEVGFDETSGDRGPQASTVHVVGKPR